MKKIISAICILLVLCSLCGCTQKLEGAQPDGEILSNDGIAVKQGDWIYFINGCMPTSINQALADTPRGKIYRMRADGSQRQAVTRKKAHNMYIFEDKIFYTSPTKKDIVLYYIGVDGTGNKKVRTFGNGEFLAYGKNGVAIEDEGKVYYYDYKTLTEKVFETGKVDGMKVSENYIYYYTLNGLATKRVGINSGVIEDVCTPVGIILEATDTEIYLVSTRLPYRVNCNTLETVKISDTFYQKTVINMKNRVIVCVESDTETFGLFIHPIDNVAGEAVGEDGNKPRKRIHTKNASAFCATDDHIFFVEEESGTVYRCDYEGKNKLVLGTVDSVNNTLSIDVVGDTLIIHDAATSGHAYYASVDGSIPVTAIKE